MKKILTPILAASFLFSTGCATMFNGSSQTVNIRSNDTEAKIYVNEEYMGKNNAVYTFKKKENYVLKAEKAGCKTTTVIPQKTFDPTTLLGIFVDWGIISILVVDGAATGAWQKFNQTSYVVDPDC
ncbi:PEGA domain-containing protein [Acinetobacter variabilis]|uniref:PEGA domain-containing protein n=1 Tax=Acinetobacter variabilis TaxID=70346 RepID=A0A7T7WH92_9GAMM|nr:PEGA domain-containing protein [Acinetobacter variabilis]QQN87708.1 PEGA domain-containing protein [Acinetobacter variabilis]